MAKKLQSKEHAISKQPFRNKTRIHLSTCTKIFFWPKIMAYKRSTKRINKTTRQITTKSPTRTRFTHSSTNSLGGRNKRTYSWSWNKNGTMRQTFTENRSGWIKRRVRTLGKIRNRKQVSGKSNTLVLKILFWTVLLPFQIAWWIIKLPFKKR
jgi:hypothetical protein